VRRLLARVFNVFRGERADREMSREIAAHLQLMEDDLVAKGMSPDAARLAAKRAWGGVEQTKENHRDARSFIWLEQLLQDFRHAWRGLARTPGFAIAAVCTLALGIGGNTTIFSVLNAVFLRALPYAAAERIASVSVYSSGREGASVNMPDYVSWKAQNSSFERLSAYLWRRGENVSTPNHAAERLQVGLVTPDFFGMLGVRPQIGREFRPEESESGRNRVAIIAHSFWRDYFNAAPDALGAELMVGGIAYTIIGVAPAGFIYPDGETGDNVAVWLPDAVDKKRSAPGNFWAGVLVIGRLKPGISMEQARADLELITRRMDDRFPNRASHAKLSVRVAPLQERLTKGSRNAIYILMGAAGCILLIVCANVANLFLARSAAREREIAVRASIGASRFRVVRLLIAESLLLGAAGGSLGIAVAYLSAPALSFLLPAGVPPSVAIDWRVLAFAAACSIGAGLFFGLAPALVLSKLELTASLKQAGAHPLRRGGVPRVRGALTVAQLALSVMLLIGAGLLIRSFVNVLRVNPGFDPRHVLIASFQLQPTKASSPDQQSTVYVPDVQRAFFDRALAAAQALPGVETAALTSQPPIGASVVYPQRTREEGEPGPEEPIYVTSASAGYFRALRIPLLQGRLFTQSDSAGAEQVAIITETAARMLFGSRNPLGRVVLAQTRL
jgi:putative ABC transport system permease protein